MKYKGNVFSRLMQSNKFLLVFSLVVAFVIWIVVAMFIDPNTNVTLRNIPIDLESQAAALQKQGLNIISAEPKTVNVEVYGKTYVVGGLKPEEIKIQPKLTSVSGAGEQNLILQWVQETGGEEYSVNVIDPPSTKVRIDRLGSRTLDIEPHVSGVSIAAGYIKESEVVTPERVTLSGPVNDIGRVAHAVVDVQVDKELSSTETVSAPIMLVDSDGNPVESVHIQKDYDTAQVSIPVLKVKDVPLTLEFLNQPKGFPLSQLQYTLSNETIKVAGPQTLIDNYNEVPLGHVDFKALGIATKEVFDVELPSGFDNVENILSVSVEFLTEDFVMSSFNLSDITVQNEPAAYNVRLINPYLNDVKIIGRPDVMENLSASDIVAEIDLSEREVVTGQIKLPVKVYVPNKGVVWATGEYVALVEITDK